MMPHAVAADAGIEEFDRGYREGGLRAMASPHLHDHTEPSPHAGCGHMMEWIDFMLETHGERTRTDDPLVKSFGTEPGFAVGCPSCGGWVRFTTQARSTIGDDEASRLPDHWHALAQLA